MRSRVVAIFILLVSACAFSQDDVPMRAMKDELARSINDLQLQKMSKPYFIAYRMDDISQSSVSAMLGSITQNQSSRTRLIGVELRVGNYALDNTNFVSMADFGSVMASMFNNISQAPLDDDYGQIRRSFWLATDSRYKKALEDLSAKKSALEMREHSDEPPDFSKVTPTTKVQAADVTRSGDELRDLARDISTLFRNTPEIYNSSVDLEFRNQYTRYVNSEGSVFTRAQPLFKLQINAQTQASDGLPISDSITLYGRTPADFPAKDVLLVRTRAMADRILKLREAKSIEQYSGPVLFEGDAAGEIFAQQFATGLMAVRKPLSDDSRFDIVFTRMLAQFGGASFVDKIGGRVLPDFINVSDNPVVQDYQGIALMGGEKVDDDAVPTRETKLIDHGVLKTLLITRVPVRAISQSTGSRRGWGPAPGNLFVTSEKSSTRDELHKQLLRMAKDRGFGYGIVVRRVGGGSASFVKMAFRMAQQEGPGSNALAEVYKLYPDGHEELLRGMELADLNASTFKDIAAVGDTPVVYTDEFVPRIGAIFSGGASASADVPIVSCVVPSLLFEDVSLVKSQGPFPNLPVSPSPLAKRLE